MNIIHALEPLPKSIFLAGPTPRSQHVPSWRPEALRLLQQLGFEGTVMVPEQNGDWRLDEYDHQILWEWEGLATATVIVFWVPRELATMPAFTTNVEFGLFAAQQKAVLGYPKGAPKMGYLDRLARRYQLPVFSTLDETLKAAIERTRG